MAGGEYVFKFEGLGDQKATVPTTAKAAGDETSTVATTAGSGDKSFADGAISRAAKTAINQTVLSPLNQVTGGLATPALNVGKAVATGASSAAIGGAVAGLIIAGVTVAVQALEQRMQKMEAKAAEANERDNTLIRAGAKTYATHYEGTLFGVKERNTSRG